MSEVHVHAPPPLSTEILVCHCPTCERQCEMLVSAFEWYEPHSVCFGCGDEWHGSEMSPRPFARAWRKQSIARAMKRAERHGLKPTGIP